MFVKITDDQGRPIGPDNPLLFAMASGGSPATEVSILGTGTAAGSVQYPDEASLTEKSITLNFGASNDTTTATFNTYLIDLNGKKSLFPGIRSNIQIKQVTSANVGDTVAYQLPPGCKIRVEYTAPVGGGTLSIKGVVQ